MLDLLMAQYLAAQQLVSTTEPATADVNPMLRSTGALHPFLFFVVHLGTAHLMARVLPAKDVAYPLFMAFNALQAAAEHFAAELPKLASAGPALGAIGFLTIPLAYYFCFKKSTGSKALIWVSLALLPVTISIGAMLGVVPPDDLADLQKANFDPSYTFGHMLVHVALIATFALATHAVPWSDDWPMATSDVSVPQSPRSPRHTTLTPTFGRQLSDDSCTSKHSVGPRINWTGAAQVAGHAKIA